jgi:hypothetical protein
VLPDLRHRLPWGSVVDVFCVNDGRALHISFKSRHGAGRGPTRHHMPCSTGPCLPSKVDFGAATCPVALDPTSLIGRTPAPPCVPWIRTPPPTRDGSGAPCVLQLHILPPWRGGLRSATCPMAPDPASLPGGFRCRHRMPCGFLWTTDSSIKKRLAGLPVQLGTHVPNARASVSNASDVRAIMCMQDV